tara:strand:- start:605 stop:2371 length:1767 start_codon:yes stop_codon:yes gene_type:complete
MCDTFMRRANISIVIGINSRVEKDGQNLLLIRVREGRGFYKKIYLKQKVQKKYWDKEKEMCTKQHENYDIINNGLVEYKNKRNKAVAKYQAGEFTVEMAYNYISGRTNAESLDNYVETHYKNTFDKNKYIDHKDRLKYFKQALNIKKPLLFADITKKLIKKYQRVQNEKIIEKQISPTTASAYVTAVMSICDEAYTEGDINYEITIPKKYKKFEKVYTGENYSNTYKELLVAIDNCHTIQRWEAVAQWLLMFGMRGIYQADIPTISEKILMEDGGSEKRSPFTPVTENKLSNWTNATLWLDHRRRKKGHMPMFIKLNRPLLLLIEKLKYSYMFTHTDYKIGGEYIVSDINNRVSIMNYDIKKYPLEHKSLWRNRQKLLKTIHPDLIRFKDARKTFFQMAEELDNTLSAKQLCGQTVDSLASNFYSNYKNRKIVEKMDALHDKVLREFKFSEVVTKLFKKFHELVEVGKAPKWMLKQSAVMQEDKEWKVLVGFVDRKPQWEKIPTKYKRFLNDNSTKEGYWVFDDIEKATTNRAQEILRKAQEERAKEVEQLETSATREELQLQLDTLVKQENYEQCAIVKKQIDALAV